MNDDQPKTPGSMVLVSRETAICSLYLVSRSLETLANGPAIESHKSAIADLGAALSRPAEQTPAVGDLDWSKSAYEHCESCNGWLPLLNGSCRPCTDLRAALARIAELEAQQGEPVAWITGVVIWPCKASAIRHSEAHGLPLEPLYRQAQPATAKVVLPVKKDPGPETMYGHECRVGFNACLDEIAKLNPTLKTVTPSRKQ